MSKFDTEQSIMECWGIVDEIKDLLNRYDDIDDKDIKAYLAAIYTIYSYKFDKLFKEYEILVKQ